MKIFCIALALVLSSNCFAQKDDLVKYLEAYKTSEFEESKKIIADYSFEQEAEYTMSEYSSISGLTFSPDIPTIKGYKAIINCKLQNKAGTFIEKRMMIVMYFDKIKKHWAVFDMREVADPKHEYETAKTDVEAGKFYTDKEYVYRNLAYWCMMAGQIKDAKKYIDLAITSAKENNNNLFSTSHVDLAIKRIM